jgi:hypothetical protein
MDQIFPFEDDIFTPSLHENLFVETFNPKKFNFTGELLKHSEGKKFTIIHLNINLIYNKIFEVKNLLDLCEFDLVMINESKLGEMVPNSSINHRYFKVLRRDRNRNGGGIIIFVKNSYKVM